MDDSDDYSEPDAVVVDRDDVSNYNPDNILPESAETIQKIRVWLKPTQYDIAGSEYRKHLASHVDGTGSWLAATETYQQWLDSEEHGLLWIKGIPGSGKSVHAAKLIETLGKQNPGCPVIYFFFRQIIVANHKPQALLRDWMDQILEYSPPLQQRLKSYLENGTSLDSLSNETVLKHLKSAFAALPEKVFCVVDALDEMDGGNDVFLEELSSLGHWRPQSCKMIITSRPVPTVETPLRNAPALVIRLQEDLVDVDISTFVQSSLAHSNIPQSQWQIVVDAVPGRANGLFLYARLAMDAFLQPGVEVSDVLSHLPADLNVLYTRLLEEHRLRSGIPESIQRLLLQSVTHATRPMRLLELAEILQILNPDGSGRSLGASKNLVREACGPLVEILPDETVSVVHHSFTEYLKGMTRPVDDVHGYPVLQAGPTHAALASACLHYFLETRCLQHAVTLHSTGLDEDDSDAENENNKDQPHRQWSTTELRMKFPFFEYATANWAAHIRASEKAAHPQQHVNVLLQQVLGSKKYMKALLQVVGDDSRDSTADFLVLHLAAKSGLVSYTQDLLRDGQFEVDVTNHLGRTPLWWAASEGHAATVEMLIAAGANPDRDDNHDGRKPLHRAAGYNHAKVAKVLLAAGVDPLTPKTKENPGRRCGNGGGTTGLGPLWYACNSGHVEAVAEFRPYVDLDTTYQALHWAVTGGHVRLAAELAQWPGVDVNFLYHGSTFLYEACKALCPGIVEILINAGADPEICEEPSVFNAQNSDNSRFVHRAPPGKTPLHLLCGSHGEVARFRQSLYEENESAAASIFRLLVDAGADVHRRTPSGQTALHAAANYSLLLSRMLLDAGASANVADDEGLTPLHECRSGEQVDLLVELGGAELEILSHAKETPLIHTLRTANTAAALRLLQLGADAKQISSSGESTLHLALGNYPTRPADSSPELIRAILDSGVDVNLRNSEGQTAFMLYHWKYPVINGLLLEAGADLNVRDFQGDTLFFQKIKTRTDHRREQSAHGDLVDLIKHGASPETRDFQGRTVLHEAIRKWERSRVSRFSNESSRLEFVLGLGLDPTVTDYQGNSLLHELASRPIAYGQHRDMMSLWERFVVEIGLDINAENNLGRTPLHVLCEQGEAGVSLDEHKMSLTIDFAIRHGAKLDATDHAGVTALHIAASRKELLVKKLLDAGASPHRPSTEGMTALHIAARSQQLNIVGLLLTSLKQKHGKAEQSALGSRGEPASDDVKILEGVDCEDKNGRSPLYYAVRSGRPEAVAMLLDAGASPASGLEACLHFEAEFSFQNMPALDDFQRLTDRQVRLDTAGRLKQYEVPNDRHLGLHTARLEEILEMLVSKGVSVANLWYNMAQPQKGSLISHALRAGSTSSLLRSGYTVSCLRRLIPEHEVEKSQKVLRFYGLDLVTSAYDPPPEPGYGPFPYIAEGKANTQVFLRFMRERQYNLVIELFRRGSAFLPHEDASPSTSNFELLVQHGFTDLAEEIGAMASDKALKAGTWHAFGNPSIPGLWYAAREPKADDMLEDQIPRSLLLQAVERDQPNVAMMRLLVETFKVDPNELVAIHGVDSGTPLHYASRGQRWWHAHQAMPFLLAIPGIDIHAKVGKDELTPLHMSLWRGGGDHGPAGLYGREAARLLVSAGADVNIVTKSGISCLGLAIDDPKMTSLLLEHGAVVTPHAVASAVKSGNVDILRDLLTRGFDLNIPVTVDKITYSYQRNPLKVEQKMALHMAGVDEKLPLKTSRNVIQALLSRGADPFSKFFVQKYGETDCTVYLFKAQAHSRPAVTVPDGGREVTTLHEIIYKRDCVHLPTFLSTGIDMEATDAYGLSILHAVCLVGRHVHEPWFDLSPGAMEGTEETVLEHLVSQGARLESRDFFGRNVLMALCSHRRLDLDMAKFGKTLNYIIQQAPNLLEQADKNGETVLWYVVRGFMSSREHWSGTVSQLLAAGASPHSRDHSGNNLLHVLSQHLGPESWVLFKDLADRGVDINERNMQGETPLFQFARRPQDHKEFRGDRPLRKKLRLEDGVVDQLRDLGADFAVKNSAGEGLLHIAAQSSAYRFEQLMAQGLDPMMEDDSQQTAIDKAAASNNIGVLQIFDKTAGDQKPKEMSEDSSDDDW